MYLYKSFRFIANVIFKIIYRIEIVNKDKIPKEGRFILCSNHISIFDPVVLSIIVSREIAWMGKKELFENKIFAKLFHRLGVFPVDRNETELSTIKHSMKVLKNEGILGIFPEGTRVKEMNLENAKPGVALIGIKTKSPILPVYIEGTYKPFSKLKVIFGDPFDFSESYGEKLTTNDYKVYGQDILSRIYSMKSE